MLLKRLFVLLGIVAIFIGGFSVFAIPTPAFAQFDVGLSEIGQTTGIPATDPRVIASRIINIALGFLAMIMVILIIYAGFLWMTAGGDSEKTKKASGYIKNAIIGLIIILLSWGIARFILTKLMEATGAGGTQVSGGSGGSGGGGFGGAGGSTQFSIKAITPTGAVETKKVIVKIVFSRTLNPESAKALGAIRVERASDGQTVDGKVEVNGSSVRFIPNKPCPEPNTDRFCFDENVEYRVIVSPSIESTAGQKLTCGGFVPECKGTFTSGTTVDVTPPEVSITYPLSGFSVSADALVNVTARLEDETAISYATFQANGEEVGTDAPIGRSPKTFNANVQWDTAGLTPGSRQTLTVTGYDVDSGSANSPPVDVMIRSSHCFDGRKNEGETGVDCGGNPSNSDYCGACTDGSCVENTDCASGMCSDEGVCVEQPIITQVDPSDGAVGTYVTIKGVNFGSSGYVTFLGSNTPVRAFAPKSCEDAGQKTWSPTEVVVQVPEGAQSGALRLTNVSSGLSDDTNALPNPALEDFLVNGVLRPGICAMNPVEGVPGTSFQLYGTGFGSTASILRFGERELSAKSWKNDRIQSSVPNVAVGAYLVSVLVGTDESNAVSFSVLSVEEASVDSPEIVEISPAKGPVGTYVTLTGKNFGDRKGTVFFVNRATGESALADTNFPDGCEEGFWKNTAVVVKVPSRLSTGGSLSTGVYSVYLRTAVAGGPESNRVDFLVNTDALAPGICSISPRIVPIGTDVTISGEYFTSGPGTVTYSSNILGENSSWSSEKIVSKVPSGAKSGPVVVRPTSSGLDSNGYLIEVRNCNEVSGVCTKGEECCGDGSCRIAGTCTEAVTSAMFAWQFSTGIIPRAPRVIERCSSGALPSPAPWSSRDGGREACVNDVMLMAFTTKLDPASVQSSAGNIVLERCTGSGNNPCASTQTASINRIEIVKDTDDQDAVMVYPASLEKDTWYQVKVGTGVRGEGENGINMVENAGKCGDGFAYCYTFRTRDDASPCALGSIQVAPDPYTSRDLGDRISYQAIPQPLGDVCRVLSCEPYGWNWRTSDESKAVVTTGASSVDGVSGQSCHQTVTPISETGSKDPVQVQASAEGATGSGDLYVRLLPPKVVSFGPDCDDACLNAMVWAEFNVPLDPSSVGLDTVRIEQCKNEACQELLDPSSIALPASSVSLQTVPGTSDSALRFISIKSLSSSGAFLFVPGRFYRVVLSGGADGGIVSDSNVPMTGLNHPDGFSWVFRVKAGDEICVPERVDVTPIEKIERKVGASQGFSAAPFTSPDSCSSKGQMLLSTTGYAWSVEDAKVSMLVRDGKVDTGSTLPDGCTDRCVKRGANGPAKNAARCGDGFLDATFEECDGGDLCNSVCLLEPIKTVAEGGTCGNGVLDRYEDCDTGRVCSDPSEASGIKNGSDCTTPLSADACQRAGGVCATKMFRGCSAGCRNLGATAGGSTCGNGDVSDGEDCDDGNLTNGDGCSSNCLREGSSKKILALCGNGKLEAGENCELVAGVLPSWCNPSTCLRVGTMPCVTRGGMCCGDGAVSDGEDCDDGNALNGDGCSSICLLEGSSSSYANPSFCGDGIAQPEAGEDSDCEKAPAGPDTFIDAFQVAKIVGLGEVNASGTMSTLIHAKTEGVDGSARYGLQCGFDKEMYCSEDGATVSFELGLSWAGCCAERPMITARFPEDNSTDACRNILINGSFNVEMDKDSLSGNFIVAQVATGSCPSGTTELSRTGESLSGFRGFVLRVWRSILSFFGVRSAVAQEVLCSGGVTGRLSPLVVESAGGAYSTDFSFTLDHVLLPNTMYKILFVGDDDLTNNTQKDGKKGIKTVNGVVADRDFVWTFTTGQEVCTVDEISVQDQTSDHPYLFLKTAESHPFASFARSRRGSLSVAISPTAEYAWEWQDWIVANKNIADVVENSTPGATSYGVFSSTVAAKNANGSTYVNARLRVTADTGNVPSTQGRVVQGSAPITVQLCENPWPSISSAPFRDEAGSPTLAGTIFESGPYYNLSMTYCRDAGEPGTGGDLPGLIINPVRTTETDSAQGILRQYLFSFSQPELMKDAIGVRIAQNPMHLSPLEWYRSKGFTGSPSVIMIDGYQGVRDGRTVYISAASTDGPTGPKKEIYSNIYVISYNDEADAVTRQIYDDLLSSMMFNRNLQVDISETCEDASGSLASDSSGNPVSCSADVDCDSYGDGMVCANFKGKLQRDLIRLGDFQSISRQMESVKSAQGKYPVLSSGSYLAGISTSLWPSWSEELSTSAGSSLPVDPINRFVTCGRCSASQTACSQNADCSTGETCSTVDGYDPKTCWNETSSAFQCPSTRGANVESTSHLYQYRSISQGDRYELSAEFEVPPPNANNPSVDWWKPVLATKLKQCTTSNERGRYCLDDSDCRTCPGGVCSASVPVTAGSCQAVGGSFRYTQICDGDVLGQSSVCGDGIIDTNPDRKICRGGTADGRSCASDSDCGGSLLCQQSEICETKGSTATRFVSCTTATSQAGQKRQVCHACGEYIDDISQMGCFPLSSCGNGRVDGVCQSDRTVSCKANSDCGSGTCLVESCDDGSLNGLYGYCNLSCSGYGAYCGDGKLSSGEVCDKGLSGSSPNKEWISDSTQLASSCNLTCSGRSAYCGDAKVTVPFEACDGNALTTSKAICSDGFTPCDTNSDCPSSGTCGTGGKSLSACSSQRVCVGTTDRAIVGKICTVDSDCPGGICSRDRVTTERSMPCNVSGTLACRYGKSGAGGTEPNWGACLPTMSCGNGVKDGLEECDDGNDVDTDGCTSSCLLNVCGDGKFYKGVEECDTGDRNGEACSTAEYGSTCSSCSTSCKFQLTQGGFCGDGIVTAATSEQCDGNATVPSSLTCVDLGYDYLSPGLTSIQCGDSCGYSGCMNCGDVPDSIPSSEEQYYTGRVEGILFDSMSQQPVPNGRVALFYKGLQVAMTTSDERGYFELTHLDRHPDCGQYRMVIDATGDNDLTELFDESLRGGYMTINTVPFSPHSSNIATETARVGLFTDAIIEDPQKIAVLINHPDAGKTYQIPRFNMIPKLREKEYIVQFWWDPTGGYDATVTDFRTALTDGRGASGFYNSRIPDIHDLVVRLPFTYTPGTFGMCSLPVSPVTYNPKNGDGRNQGIDPDTLKLRMDEWTHGIDGVDHADPFLGMANCTNKIRATASRTCTGGDVPGNFIGKLGCSNDLDCNGNADKYFYPGSTCSTSVPEPSRSGPLNVLSGTEGAYLFCFHPEWPEGDANRVQPNCTNFVLPPQTVFINSNGGQYDILVSAYSAFTWGAINKPPSIQTWLWEHNAKVRVYDVNGYKGEWRSFGSDAGWNPYENKNVCMNIADARKIAKDEGMSVLSAKTAYMYSSAISTVWTPISLNTDTGKIISWNDGWQSADNHYFSDLFTSEFKSQLNPGWGQCWERTFVGVGEPSSASNPLFPATIADDGYMVCADEGGRYGGDYNVLPACDSASKSSCPAGTYCKTASPNSGTMCIKRCKTDAECTEGFCGGAYGVFVGGVEINDGR